jgi:phosphohistidine phosphatase
MIGHNPGMQDLALELAHVDGSEDLRRIGEKFPTSAIAVLTHRGSWTSLACGSADLTAFHIPRGVKS